MLFDDSCRNFWKISRFLQILSSVTYIWANEACASTKRRASDSYRSWRLSAPSRGPCASPEEAWRLCTEACASVQRRAPLCLHVRLCWKFLCLQNSHVRLCTWHVRLFTLFCASVTQTGVRRPISCSGWMGSSSVCFKLELNTRIMFRNAKRVRSPGIW